MIDSSQRPLRVQLLGIKVFHLIYWLEYQQLNNVVK